MRAKAHGLTDVGMVRKSNEDYFLADEALSLFVVCDGVGGSAFGEIASETAAQVIREIVAKNKALIDRFERDSSQGNRDAVAGMLQLAIQGANARIRDLGAADPQKRGMCTTAVVLLLCGSHAFLSHVGDSRIYLLRDGKTHQLTSDHSVSAEMIKQGVWTPDEAKKSSYSNTLTRAVGAQDFVQCDTLMVELLKGDLFLLCSDGLHNYFDRDVLAGFSRQPELSLITQDLVRFAKERGGRDNITALLVRMDEPVKTSAAFDALKKSEALGKVPLFRYLSYSELMQVLSLVKIESFEAGAEMIREGSVGDEMYILLSGAIEVVKAGQVLAQRGKGEVFGDMGLFDHAPRSATIRTVERTAAMAITRKDLLGLLRKEPQIAVKFLWSLNQELSGRLRKTSQDLAEARAGRLGGADLPFALPAKD